MKKQILLLGFMLFVSSVHNAEAQLGNKTVVKFNLTGVAFKSYAVQYERILTPKSSITVTASVSPNAPLPFKNALMDQFGENEDARRAIGTTLFTKYNATVEYRFYIKGHAPSGWYVAPFARYMNMDISQDYTYTPSDNILHHAHLNAKFGAVAGGVMLGHQWVLGKHLALDLWLLGPFYGSRIKADFVGEDPLWPSLKPADVTKLHNDIESTRLPLYTTTATLPLPVIHAKLVGPYYGVRAFGLALGYTF
jgi:hypothetical protein